ncbi:MAG: CotH kinase family protein [Polyangiales bacterium]
MRRGLSLLFVLIIACGDDATLPIGDASTAPDVSADAALDSATDAEPRDAQADAPDPVASVYDPERVLEVSITLPPASWDSLRNQSRSLVQTLSGDCLDAPFDQPFSWFEGSVTIDGEEFARVDVRKKGFIGSLSTERPGLKLDLSEYVEGQRYSGVRRFTLNNSVSDPSVIRQCLGYALFAQAGIPSPRCNFAHVTVNGEDLGLYVNVEAIKGDFLEAGFGNRDGNFYEGTLSDFTPEMATTFEPKNNEEVTERTDIMPVVRALEIEDDATMLSALEALVDIDAFINFWAMETLTEHTDGYNANRNNYYVYFDEADGLMRFVPWGIDSILGGATVAQNLRESVYARAALSHRLYQLPSVRARYFARLDVLLDTLWDETAIDAEIQRMRDLVRPFAEGEVLARMTRSTDELRSAVVNRRASIEVERGPEDPDVGDAEPAFACFMDQGSVMGTFETTWGTLDMNSFSSPATLELVIAGETLTFNTYGSAAGIGDQGATLLLLGNQGAGRTWVLSISPPRPLFTPGTVDLDAIGVTGFVGTLDFGAFNLFGFFSGEVVFSEAGSSAGAAVVGTLDGSVYTGL